MYESSDFPVVYCRTKCVIKSFAKEQKGIVDELAAQSRASEQGYFAEEETVACTLGVCTITFSARTRRLLKTLDADAPLAW
jgi:hypothetical protein